MTRRTTNVLTALTSGILAPVMYAYLGWRLGLPLALLAGVAVGLLSVRIVNRRTRSQQLEPPDGFQILSCVEPALSHDDISVEVFWWKWDGGEESGYLCGDRFVRESFATWNAAVVDARRFLKNVESEERSC